MYNLLSGLRVIEAASFVAGPSCGLHLAQMGAEVIRIDTIGGGPDYTRWPVDDKNQPLYWEGLNKGKRSIAVNLRDPRGRDLMLDIITAQTGHSGLLITNFPVEGFLSYDVLAQRRKDLICMRIMGWPDGRPAMDYTVNAASGLPFLTGPAECETPVNHLLPAWDLLTGAYGAFALLAAEKNRQVTGRGEEIRLPLSDIVASSLSYTGMVAETLVRDLKRERTGNDVYGAFGRDFTTRDGKQIMVVAITAKQWRELLASLGLETNISSLEKELGLSFAKEAGLRFEHRERLFPIFQQAISYIDFTDLAERFDRRGVTWSPFRTMYDAVRQDERMFASNPIFESIDHISGHRYPAAGTAATLPTAQRGHVRGAPRLGQDTDAVLADVLGLSEQAIGHLHDQGLVASQEDQV